VASLPYSATPFAGKVAVVFGAARPPYVGRALAVRLATGGADVAVIDRVVEPDADGRLPDTACCTAGELEELADSLRAMGRKAIVAHADPSDFDAVHAAVAAAERDLGPVTLCATVSGGTGAPIGDGALLTVSEEAFDRAIALNLKGAWVVARAAAAAMVAGGRPGAIAVMSSFATHTGGLNVGAFSAAKAGANRIVSKMAEELAPHRIRVNAASPLGINPTGGRSNPQFLHMAADAGTTVDDYPRQRFVAGRYQDPDETAAVLAFLLSDDASFVNGVTVDVAGGGFKV
jgi:NAD(P)-dependent dehydrogenase (short-subunit alcohol dehydrogenase family)